MNTRGKKSTIVISILLAIVSIFAIYLLLLDTSGVREMADSGKEAMEDSHHVAELFAAGFVAMFGALTIAVVILLILSVLIPSVILIIFTLINTKSDIKWVKILNIIYDLVLLFYIGMSIYKFIMLFITKTAA